MKNLSRLAVILAFFYTLPLTLAGPVESTVANTAMTAPMSDEYVPLDTFNIDSGYVFESDLNHGGSHGKQDEIQNEIEYGHRIHLSGNFYIHLGLAYDRFDFGSTNSPVPNHLQSFAGVFGIEVMKGSDVGAFISIRPGFYTQNDIGISSFDMPISLGRIFVVQDKKFYIFLGAYAAFLHGGLPVWPLAGVIWIPNEKVRLMATLPDPKLIYSVSDKLDLYLGGELVGGSFRTDRNPGIEPGKLNGAQVDFVDYRVGVGFNYDLSKLSSLDFGAGYSIQREFDFDRAGETYRTDPSPYIRLTVKLAF
jgi:hypothetical protein